MPRGALPPEQQLGQLGQLGLGPGSAPPGLLQMAMDGGDGGRGGVPSFSEPQPQIGQPPSFTEEGSGAKGFFPKAFTSQPGGGFFTLEDYYKQIDPTGGATPHQYQEGQNLPSTTNWQLLPPDWRKPGNFMINGRIIDRASLIQDLHRGQDPSGEGGGNWSPIRATAGQVGYPSFFHHGSTARLGYPGQQSPWAIGLEGPG